MRFPKIIKGDITKLRVECIVNAANSTLLGGGGVDGAIHFVAGPQLLEECKTLGGCKTGQSKITKGYNLPAKYVIHTVGPIFNPKKNNNGKLLRSCYKTALNLAKKNNIHSIAFPSISTGIYQYPLAQACIIATDEILKWMDKNYDYDLDIFVCCFNEETYQRYMEALYTLC